MLRAISRNGTTYTVDGAPSQIPGTVNVEMGELEHAASVDMLIGRKARLLRDVFSDGTHFKLGEVLVVVNTVQHFVTLRCPKRRTYARRLEWAMIAPV